MSAENMFVPFDSPVGPDMGCISDKALLMMAKMGYKSGAGLGKNAEGDVQPIQIPMNLGKRGLGCTIEGLEASCEAWDFNRENINVEEEIKWISSSSDYGWWPDCGLDSWTVRAPPKYNIEDETNFCDEVLLGKILKAKAVFDELDSLELCKARSRANPFETIRSVFFMNRAALKMANIDAVTGFMFTNIDQNPAHRKPGGPYYFADVCAGPGGFSEYLLWRKKWMFKGFGFTLKGDHDFELADSHCASPVTFSAQYGLHGDGDIRSPDNIRHFAERVRHESEGKGVHFMMSDGGFSVEGNENLQEVLSKQLYVCQCVMALEVVRPQGHFVTKVFDLFTPFSVGLVFLMYNCFEKVTILKPNTSRPANSERYLVCYGLKPCWQTEAIKQYLLRIAVELRELKQVQSNASTDISEIVPLAVLTSDEYFRRYVTESNNRLGESQEAGLLKLAAFCRNPTLTEPRQDALRTQCLRFWQIPDRPKTSLPRFTADELVARVVSRSELMLSLPKQICDTRELTKLLTTANWFYTLSGCRRSTNICNFYASVGGSRVYRLQRFKWVKVKNLHLISGTLLFGEMVKETVVQNERVESKPSLHVFDALRLGDISLADLSFSERVELIQSYCEAVNHESQADRVRVRAKPAQPLKKFTSSTELSSNNHVLPILGFGSIKECYPVNSILLYQMGADDSFFSMFTSRTQIFLDENFGEFNASNSTALQLFKKCVQYANSNI